jgi:hypothetical protein
MTLIELKKIVDWHCQNERNHNLRVCIPNNSGGMGGDPVTDVKNAVHGIDWNADKFMIIPSVKLMEITE